ncbi:MAG TPA: tRNA (adenosine(37)-N6)-threonylcarbamoyltransferase complex dimerization subunit type 1 TsaB [Bryobacteraceae bacterium]|nr:tRNA (adenosine(37)-N6)-threonylcarbamoyltransferase complex dimerization subunit type 1 TsaB [Bryobacteraceae bacterium]
MILAVDTTSEFGSLALMRAPDMIDELPLHSPEGFAHILFDHIQRLLDRNSAGAADVRCFAAAAGPGSFTGVRVGLAAVKGLAEAVDRPAVAVSNLQALAVFGSRPLRATLLDARRGQIYGAVYDAQLRPVLPEMVTSLPHWIAGLPPGDLEFISTDLAPFRHILPEAPIVAAPRALAAAVARVAWERWQNGQAQDPAALDANYVRRSDAELFWKE